MADLSEITKLLYYRIEITGSRQPDPQFLMWPSVGVTSYIRDIPLIFFTTADAKPVLLRFILRFAKPLKSLRALKKSQTGKIQY